MAGRPAEFGPEPAVMGASTARQEAAARRRSATAERGSHRHLWPNSPSTDMVTKTITMSRWWMDSIYQWLSIQLREHTREAEVTSVELVKAAILGEYYCKRAGDCNKNLNDICPQELKKVVNGKTVACKSACLAMNTDQYCCRGRFGTPETCKSSNWPKNYPAIFKVG